MTSMDRSSNAGAVSPSPHEQRKLHAERERLIAGLSDRFSAGDLEIDDFERRLDDLHRATSLTELHAAAPDLWVAPEANAVPQTSTALVPAEAAPSQKKVLAIFGSSERHGTWTVPRRLTIAAVFGNIQLDFREARLPTGVVDVEVRAVFGNVEIFVPPQLAVETEGAGVFGNFEHMERAPAVPDPQAPLLRITGVSVFGNIEIVTRLAGAAEGKRRRHR